MSFQKSSNSWRAKAHLGGVKLPVLVGVTALAILVIAAAAAALVGAASSDGLTILAAEEESGDEEELAEGSEESGDSDEDEAAGSGDDSGADAEAEEEPETVVVYVCGAVVSPGVFELEEGARIQDAILAAGGFSDDAATESLNLASLVEDGEQIDVPTLEELEEAEAAGIELTTTTTGSSASDSSDSSSDDSSSSSSTGLININTATAEELEELPGIGEVTAANIVADREENGPFSSIEDITRVSGIGDAKYAAIADLICVE